MKRLSKRLVSVLAAVVLGLPAREPLPSAFRLVLPRLLSATALAPPVGTQRRASTVGRLTRRWLLAGGTLALPFAWATTGLEVSTLSALLDSHPKKGARNVGEFLRQRLVPEWTTLLRSARAGTLSRSVWHAALRRTAPNAADGPLNAPTIAEALVPQGEVRDAWERYLFPTVEALGYVADLSAQGPIRLGRLRAIDGPDLSESAVARPRVYFVEPMAETFQNAYATERFIVMPDSKREFDACYRDFQSRFHESRGELFVRPTLDRSAPLPDRLHRIRAWLRDLLFTQKRPFDVISGFTLFEELSHWRFFKAIRGVSGVPFARMSYHDAHRSLQSLMRSEAPLLASAPAHQASLEAFMNEVVEIEAGLSVLAEAPHAAYWLPEFLDYQASPGASVQGFPDGRPMSYTMASRYVLQELAGELPEVGGSDPEQWLAWLHSHVRDWRSLEAVSRRISEAADRRRRATFTVNYDEAPLSVLRGGGATAARMPAVLGGGGAAGARYAQAAA